MRDVFQLFVLKCGLAFLGVIALTGVYWIVMPRLLRLFRWLSRLGMVGAVVVGLGLTVAIDYAGEKNDSTNNPAPPTGDTPAQVESIWVDPTSCPSRVEDSTGDCLRAEGRKYKISHCQTTECLTAKIYNLSL